MKNNILTAIVNIYKCPVYHTTRHYAAHNRANNMGKALELFVKDAFCNSFELTEQEATRRYSEHFAYLGNQNNPPDAILKNGDAIEVKKIESKTSGLALNSSYPKSKIFSTSNMITDACRKSDGGEWREKDLIYSVGVVDKSGSIKQLCFVYGKDYAASHNIYDRIKDKIKGGILEIPEVEFADTNELGRVNRVDPLGITYLRIRGMWHIENPFKVFQQTYDFDTTADFNFLAIINEEKYLTFPEEDRKNLEGITAISIRNSSVKSPDNPAIMENVKIITFARSK